MRRPRSRWLLGSALCLAATALTGCGQSNVASVDGSVSLDGTSLEGGAIAFYPAGTGPVFYADVQPDGSYHLQTSSHDGVVPGAYVATVSHRRGRPEPGMSVAEIEALEIVPVRYSRKETSDLKFDIAPGENTIDIKMSTAK